MADETNTEFVDNNEETQTEIKIDANDLAVLARAVDIASQRGAFRANELSQIGTAFDKVSGFLNFIQQAQQKSEEEQQPEEEQATDED